MPRAGLTPQAVVEEAEKVVDDLGAEGLTLAVLAQRLGVKQPSLYKHIDGVAGLRRAIAVRGAREMTDALRRAAVGRSRGEAITAIADATRKWALAHPGRYLAAQAPPEPGDAEYEKVTGDFLQMYTDVLSGFGLAGDDAIDAIRVVRSALHGFVSFESAGMFAMPQDIDRSFRRLVGALIGALDHWSAESGAVPADLS